MTRNKFFSKRETDCVVYFYFALFYLSFGRCVGVQRGPDFMDELQDARIYIWEISVLNFYHIFCPAGVQVLGFFFDPVFYAGIAYRCASTRAVARDCSAEIVTSCSTGWPVVSSERIGYSSFFWKVCRLVFRL